MIFMCFKYNGFYCLTAWRRALLTAAKRPLIKLYSTTNTTPRLCSWWPATCSALRKLRYNRTSVEWITQSSLIVSLVHWRKVFWAAGHYAVIISVGGEQLRKLSHVFLRRRHRWNCVQEKWAIKREGFWACMLVFVWGIDEDDRWES